MNFLKEFFKSVFFDNEFVVYMVDCRGQILDGYSTTTKDTGIIIEEAFEYFERQEDNFFLFY